MLTPQEQAAWDAYVEEMAARGACVDLTPLIEALLALGDSTPGQVIAAALGVGQVPTRDLAQRLTLRTRTIVQTGRVPD